MKKETKHTMLVIISSLFIAAVFKLFMYCMVIPVAHNIVVTHSRGEVLKQSVSPDKKYEVTVSKIIIPGPQKIRLTLKDEGNVIFSDVFELDQEPTRIRVSWPTDKQDNVLARVDLATRGANYFTCLFKNNGQTEVYHQGI